MTVAWKELVIATLTDNKKKGRKPSNLAQIASALEADKRGIYETFNLEREPPQMSSAYVDQICEILHIAPPMVEASSDPDLERDLDVVRGMDPESRRALVLLAKTLKR
jgi:hypothetical protein